MEPKPYKENDRPDQIVCEPLMPYGVSELHLDMNRQYTYADYLTWNDNIRRELVDGFIRLMSGVRYLHNRVTVNFTFLLKLFVKKRKGKCEIFHSQVDVRLPKNGETADNKIYTVLQPDICVVCDPAKIDEKGIIGAPDLVVEVQSPSTARYVMSKKFEIYESAGVKEYWVVYPQMGLTVFLLQEDGKYDWGTTYDIVYQPDAKIPVKTIKGLVIGLKELLEG